LGGELRAFIAALFSGLGAAVGYNGTYFSLAA